MEVKGLQGGGATGTPVAAKLHVAFLQGARLDVELEVFWVSQGVSAAPSISAGSVRGPAEERPECPSHSRCQTD